MNGPERSIERAESLDTHVKDDIHSPEARQQGPQTPNQYEAEPIRG